MRSLLKLTALLAGAALIVGYASWQLGGGMRPTTSAEGTPWSTDGSGHRLAVRWIEACNGGQPCIPHRRRYAHLDDGVMFAFASEREEPRPTRADAEALLRWVARRPQGVPIGVEAGSETFDRDYGDRANTLILFAAGNGHILELLGLRVIRPNVKQQPPREWVSSASRRAEQRWGLPGTVTGSGQAVLDIDDKLRRRVFKRLGVHGGSLYALYTRGEQLQCAYLTHGYGQIVVLLDPWIVSNEGLVEGDNALLLTGLVGLFCRQYVTSETGERVVAPRPVFVDERYHGRDEPIRLLDFLAAFGLPLPLAIHLLLLFGCLVWHCRHRLGSPHEPVAALSRQAIEHAQALAEIHWRAGHVSVLGDDLRRRLLTALRRVAPLAVTPGGEVQPARLPEDPTFPRSQLLGLLAGLRSIRPTQLRPLALRVDATVRLLAEYAERGARR